MFKFWQSLALDCNSNTFVYPMPYLLMSICSMLSSIFPQDEAFFHFVRILFIKQVNFHPYTLSLHLKFKCHKIVVLILQIEHLTSLLHAPCTLFLFWYVYYQHKSCWRAIINSIQDFLPLMVSIESACFIFYDYFFHC